MINKIKQLALNIAETEDLIEIEELIYEMETVLYDIRQIDEYEILPPTLTLIVS